MPKSENISNLIRLVETKIQELKKEAEANPKKPNNVGLPNINIGGVLPPGFQDMLAGPTLTPTIEQLEMLKELLEVINE